MTDEKAIVDRAPLKPAHDVQKFLISASCHLAGRLDTPNLLIAAASPGLGNRATHQRWPRNRNREIIPEHLRARSMIRQRTTP
jgi:hypothetical protein